MKLKQLVKAVRGELPITPRMDAWLTQPNPQYSAEALQFAHDVLSKKVGGNRGDRQPFRSSSVGMCERRRVFSALQLQEAGEISAKLGNIFATGNFLHLKWQLAGLTEGWLAEAEKPVDDPALHFGGTLDGVLFDGSGFEFKTINSNGYAMVQMYGPKELHVRQVHSYMMLTGIDVFSIVYENKDTGEWSEHRVPKDDKVAKELDRELGYLNQAWEQRKLPQMLPNCETKEGTVYRNCPFREICPTVQKWPTIVKGQIVGT